MPTSPMPATGFVITVRKSEVLDLNITLDQAIQFIVSCGVVCATLHGIPVDGLARVDSRHLGVSNARSSVRPTAVEVRVGPD